MRRSGFRLAILLGVLIRTYAQDLPVLPLGRGDVVNVEVEGEADLTKRVTISRAGDITLPMLKDRLPVGGLLPDAMEKVIADAYKRAQLLIDPTVRVTPAEYHSYLVKVTGAVNRPYEFQAIERHTLLNVLATAGGPAPNSNGRIEIILRDVETGRETKQIIAIKDLLESDDPKYNIVPKGGEEIHLPPVAQVPNDKLI
jgi:protein involved in polysaccharide export with SLBB domain